jgi:hypothetical protein
MCHLLPTKKTTPWVGNRNSEWQLQKLAASQEDGSTETVWQTKGMGRPLMAERVDLGTKNCKTCTYLAKGLTYKKAVAQSWSMKYTRALSALFLFPSFLFPSSPRMKSKCTPHFRR